MDKKAGNVINIIIWNNKYVEIEIKKLEIESKEDLIGLIKYILDKAYYSGETLCLESAEIDSEKGKVLFTEIERWK